MASPSSLLGPGSHLDRYEILRPVAQGGMGAVWLGRLRGKHGFEKLVAIKTILVELAREARFREMFLEEARLASRVEHPHVAQVLDLGEEGETLYLVMEWVDGPALDVVSRRLKQRGAEFPLPLALRIVADAAAGVHAAHVARDAHGDPLGLVHRDVSPQNVLLDERGVVKVIDFGIARARDGLVDEASARQVRGKMSYMAPEQAQAKIIDRRADIWSLGAVLHELLSGSPPVRGAGDLLALVERRAHLPALPRVVPGSVRSAVTRAMAMTPSARFESAHDFVVELESALASLGPPTTAADVARLIAEELPRAIAHRPIASPTRPRAEQTSVDDNSRREPTRTTTGASSLDARAAQIAEEAELRAAIDRRTARLDAIRRETAYAANELRLRDVGELETRRAHARHEPLALVVCRMDRGGLVTPASEIARVGFAIEGGAAVMTAEYDEIVALAPGMDAVVLRERLEGASGIGRAVAVAVRANESFGALLVRARRQIAGDADRQLARISLRADDAVSAPALSTDAGRDPALDEVLSRQTAAAAALLVAIDRELPARDAAASEIAQRIGEPLQSDEGALIVRDPAIFAALAVHEERRARAARTAVAIAVPSTPTPSLERAMEPFDVALVRDGAVTAILISDAAHDAVDALSRANPGMRVATFPAARESIVDWLFVNAV